MKKVKLCYFKSYTSQDYLDYFKEIFPDIIFNDIEELAKKYFVSIKEGYDKKLIKETDTKTAMLILKKKDQEISIAKDELLSYLRNSIILFTGGTDVNSFAYNQKPHSSNDIPDMERDFLESSLFEFIKRAKNIVFVGICRGAQHLTVLNGGKLIQHVTNHDRAHSASLIEITDNNKINKLQDFLTNSSHHQMMYPFNLKKDQYRIIAASSYFLSEVYMKNNEEEFILPEKFIEPEIVHYPFTNSLCIQGHPEWNKNGIGSFRSIVSQLINQFSPYEYV